MRGRGNEAGAVLLAVAAVVTAAAFVSSASLARAESSGDAIIRAASATYVHGITADLARAEIGEEGVPVLLDLLADPQFPRRDNVVAFLGYLGAGESAQAVIDFLADPPAPVAVPEEDRALLNAPQALGQIGARGNQQARAALLAMTAPGSNGGVLAAAASHGRRPEALRDDLLEMSLRGLAYAGTPAAQRRLGDIAAGRVIPAAGGRDLGRAAASALGLFKSLHGSPDANGASDAAAAVDGGGITADASTTVAAASDGTAVVHDHGIDFANHVSHPDPMTDARLDSLLDTGSLRVGRSDFTEDVACCNMFYRLGSGQTFGSAGDGLDVIDDSNELIQVLNDAAARVKVVRAINYCGSTASNIIGCSWVGGDGMAVVRRSNANSEAVLWVHEYGHNVGLSHNTDSRYIMYGVDYGTNNAVSGGECDAFHSPSSGTHADVTQAGACTDADADGVQDGIDNCPATANPDQIDSNGNGVGDACDFAGCGNGILETGEQCDGGDLGGATCTSLGYTSGTLACTSNCMLDTSGCAVCGDGVREDGEACDGGDLGGATCAQNGCTSGTPSCTAACSLDFSTCSGCPVCDGDGVCEQDEDCVSCPSDCVVSSGAQCGNGICESAGGEDCVSCPQDCRGVQNGKPAGRFCCGDGGGQNPLPCSDAMCRSAGYSCTDVAVTSSCCGDGACDGVENGFNCGIDCGPPPFCGDGQCTSDEDPCSCATDCGTAPAESCSNGVDDDCDGAADCADSDCGSAPSCQAVCAVAGSPCAADTDCCSLTCRGKRGARTCK